MGDTQAQRAALQAVAGDGDPTTPMGTAKVQKRNGAYYVRIPVELVREHEIEAGDEVEQRHHPASDTLLTKL